MNASRIFVTFLGIVIGLGLLVNGLIYLLAPEEDPAVSDAMSAYNMTFPRAPVEAKKLHNPIPSSPEVVAMGKRLFEGKGNCYVCHGKSGAGDGESASMMTPPPRDLTDPRFQHLRTDGELFWATKFGVAATSMFSYIPRHLSEEEGWMVIRYIRTLGRSDRAPA